MCFKYDPATHKDDLATKGYAHLKQVLSDDFVAELKQFYARAIADETAETRAGHVAGKKRQYVFDFSSRKTALAFRAGVAALAGMDEDRVTISERHLKVYDAHTNPWPAPHKDRRASQISIGLPVHLTPGSTVCVFPNMDRTPNPEDKADFLTSQELPDPKSLYDSSQAVFLNEELGDLILFNGSSIYHERVQAAGTAVLYIKINDMGDDPLGENIFAQPSADMEPA